MYLKSRTSYWLSGLLILVGFLCFGVNSIQGQEEARFGYSVANTTVDLEVLSPGNDLFFYGWSFGTPCGTNETNCYQATGTDVTIGDMWNYVGEGTNQTTVYLEVYDENGSDLIAETSADINLGAGVSYGDADGDGIIDSEENSGCINDPNPSCGGGGDDGDGGDDGGGEDGGDGGSDGLVNCGNPGADGVLQESEMCDYQALLNMINGIISWLVGILVIVATLLFMYAGILYLTAGSDSGQVDTAKGIFQNVAGGFLIVLLAFTLIATLVNILTRQDWRDNWDQAIPIELSTDADTHHHLS
jgi:hypothetical protein